MSLSHSPSIVRDGLVLYLDAANPKSFYGTDLIPNSFPGISYTANQNVTITPLNSSVIVTSNQNTSTPGLLTTEISVTPNTRYTLRIKGQNIIAPSGGAYLYVTGNNTGNLLWTGAALTNVLEWKTSVFTTGASDTSIRVGFLWSGVEVGCKVLLEDINLYQTQTWYDLSGKGYNATLSNNPVLSDGMFQMRSASGSCASSIFNEGVLKSNNERGSWTIEALFKYISAPSSDEAFVAGRTGCHGGIYIMSNGTLRYDIKTNQCWTGYSSVNAGTLVTNNFYHAVMTYSDGTTYGYLNGQYINSSSIDLATYDLNPYSDFLCIGGWTNNTMYRTNTDISIVRCYNKSLSLSEIKQNFNSLRGRYKI